MPVRRIHTIGYATKSIDAFVAQLRSHAIDVVADIRSVPYSNYYQDFRQETLRNHLRQQALDYVYLGRELGPRSPEPAHYDAQGQVQYERLRQSDVFAAGIRRLEQGLAKGFGIALMCAEKDPLHCHRSLLVAHHLQRMHSSNPDVPLEICHILHDGSLETQDQLEQRLVDEQAIPADLFSTDGSAYDTAYRHQTARTAWRKPG